MKYYTYAYLRQDGSPYYIGKGSGKRMFYKSGKSTKPPKDRSRIIKLKDNLTEEEAFKHERYLISVLGKKCDGTGMLMNIADGGNQPPTISGDKHHMKTEEYKRRVSEKLTGRKGHPAWNKGIPSSQEMKDKVTGEGNGRAKWWRITFSDGRQIERCGLTNWCEENGYNKSKVSALYHKKEGRTKHKDIIKVECISE